MFPKIFYIRRYEYDELYYSLVLDYLHHNVPYDKCVENSFLILDKFNYNLTNEHYRLIYSIRDYDNYGKGFSFYVEPNSKKIIHEGIISYHLVSEMSYGDFYYSPNDLDKICKKYFLERKSERRIKIEKLLNND